MAELNRGGEDDDDQEAVRIQQELHEELSVVEADAIVDPWAMVIHVENATVANTAMVSSIWLPYIAHLAVTPPLCLITHVEAPIGRHNTWICHDALVECCHQVEEENVVDEHDQDSVEAPKLRGPNKADKRDVNPKDVTQDSGNKAHAIDALGGEGSSSLHGCV